MLPAVSRWGRPHGGRPSSCGDGAGARSPTPAARRRRRARCGPPSTTGRPSTSTCRRRRRSRRRAPGRGRRPRCGRCRAARRPGRRARRPRAGPRPASPAARAVGQRGEQLGRAEPAALAGGEPLVHLQRPGLLEQVDHGVLVAAQRQRRARRRAARGPGRCRRRGPARWSGTGRPRCRSRRAARCRRRSGGWRARRWCAGPSTPSSASSPVGVSPWRRRHAAFSAGCSDRCTCRGRPSAAFATTASASRGTARTEWTRADAGVGARGARSAQACGVAVAEAQLRAFQGGVEAAREVAGVQQGEADARVGRGGAQGLAAWRCGSA